MNLAGSNSNLEGVLLDDNDVVWRVTGSGAGGSLQLSVTQPAWDPFSLTGSYAASPGGDLTVASSITGKVFGSGFDGEAASAFRSGPRLSGGVPTLGYNPSFALQWRNKPDGTTSWSGWALGAVTSGAQNGSTYSGRLRVTEGAYTYTGSFSGIVQPSGFTSLTITMDSAQGWPWNQSISFDTGFVDPDGRILYGYGIDQGDEIRIIAEW